MESNSRTVIAKNKDLSGLREEQRVHNEALDAARAEQAKVRTAAMQKEKAIKKADKVLEDKVLSLYSYLVTLDNTRWTETRSSGDRNADHPFDAQDKQCDKNKRGGGTRRGEASGESQRA